jgi:putative ABC transport system ATP-binding protein
MEKCVIDIINISKVFNPGENEVKALRDVSLKIYDGEFVSLMGSSGSGKSTLLNILGCLDKPTTGAYLLDGQKVSDLSKSEISTIRNRKFGFVFQSYNLLPKTSAMENVELPLLYNSSISIKERRRKAEEALVSVGLENRMHHKTNELSGGQQQRVAIARALVNEPKVIFADEPTGNLDSKTSYQVMELFQNLNEKGILIVMVSHEPDIVEMGKRKIILHDGEIIDDIKISNPTNARELFLAAIKK